MWWIIFIVIATIFTFAILVGSRSSLEKNQRDTDSEPRKNDSSLGHKKSNIFLEQEEIKSIEETRGEQGEELSQEVLKNLLMDDEYLLTNLLIPLKNGGNTEIDMLLITHKGLFCIEVKTWVGEIYGDSLEEEWKQVFYDSSIKKHRNPIKQNESHCEILQRKLHTNYYFQNIVLFITNDKEKIHTSSNDVFTLATFKNHYQKLPILIPFEEDLEDVYEQAIQYKATKEQLSEHRKRMKEKFQDRC